MLGILQIQSFNWTDRNLVVFSADFETFIAINEILIFCYKTAWTDTSLIKSWKLLPSETVNIKSAAVIQELKWLKISAAENINILIIQSMINWRPLPRNFHRVQILNYFLIVPIDLKHFLKSWNNNKFLMSNIYALAHILHTLCFHFHLCLPFNLILTQQLFTIKSDKFIFQKIEEIVFHSLNLFTFTLFQVFWDYSIIKVLW